MCLNEVAKATRKAVVKSKANDPKNQCTKSADKLAFRAAVRVAVANFLS